MGSTFCGASRPRQNNQCQGRGERSEDRSYFPRRPEHSGDLANSWLKRLNDAQVPAGRVNDILEAIDLAEELELEPLVTLGEGHTPQIQHPVRWTAYRPTEPTPPPTLGEHSRRIRAWLEDDSAV